MERHARQPSIADRGGRYADRIDSRHITSGPYGLPQRGDDRFCRNTTRGSFTITGANSAGIIINEVTGGDPTADVIRTVWAGPIGGPTTTITPSSTTVSLGAMQAFTASTQPNETFTWTATHGSISGTASTETYTAPGSGTTDSVTWTSVDLPLDTATAAVTLMASGALALSGPQACLTGQTSTNFTVAATSLSGSDTVTPSDSSGGGAFTPTALSFSSGSSSETFTYENATPGTYPISITDTLGSTITGSPISFLVANSLSYEYTATTDTISITPITILYGALGWVIHWSCRFAAGSLSTTLATNGGYAVLFGQWDGITPPNSTVLLLYSNHSNVIGAPSPPATGNFAYLVVTNGTGGVSYRQQTWTSQVDPFSGFEGDGLEHKFTLEWRNVNPITSDEGGYSLLSVDGATLTTGRSSGDWLQTGVQAFNGMSTGNTSPILFGANATAGSSGTCRHDDR